MIYEPFKSQIWQKNVQLEDGETHYSCARRCKVESPESQYYQKYKSMKHCECLTINGISGRRLIAKRNENFSFGYTQTCGKRCVSYVDLIWISDI